MKSEKERIDSLIRQLQSGNKEAFEELYKLTSPRAYFIALKIVNNEHDAEDVLQESYIKMLEKIDEIDTSQNFTSWFYRVVANKSKDFLKSRKLLLFEGNEDELFEDMPDENLQFSPEENLNQEELRREVMAAIDELTVEKRACIMMMYFGEMSVSEIAESIEVPESTVKNRLFTARKDLKARFEKNGNILYGAALGGVLIWAISKTGEATASAFAASAASDTVLAGINAASVSAASSAATASAATAASVTSVSSTAVTGTGIAAKVAALSVAQKVVAGVAAVSVIGGSTAGVATVAKKVISERKPQYVEEVTTAPSQSEDYAFAVITTEESTTELILTTEKTEPAATVRDGSTTKRPSETSTTKSAQTTKTTTGTSTTKQTTTQKETTTKRQTTTRPTTTKPTTTRPTTTTEPETEETTTKPTTTQPTTTQPATTEPTTQAPATVNVEVIDINENVVATFSFTVEAGTEMTWEYLVSQIKSKGYEPKAGIYGDAIDAVAESGTAYTITAEL